MDDQPEVIQPSSPSSEQTSVSLPQNVPPNPPPPQPQVTQTPENTVFTSAPPTAQPQQPKAKSKKLLGLLIIIVVIVIVGVILILVGHKTNQPSAATSNPKTPATSTVASNAACTKGDVAVPLGSSATDGAFVIRLLGVVYNPATTGDQPDSGTQYLEADFSITTIANQNNYALNMDYLPATDPQGGYGCGYQLSPIDMTDGAYNPITFKSIPTKSVQVAGKQSIESNVIPADGTAATVQAYALFEIVKGQQKGQIVWSGLNNKSYNFEF